MSSWTLHKTSSKSRGLPPFCCLQLKRIVETPSEQQSVFQRPEAVRAPNWWLLLLKSSVCAADQLKPNIWTHFPSSVLRNFVQWPGDDRAISVSLFVLQCHWDEKRLRAVSLSEGGGMDQGKPLYLTPAGLSYPRSERWVGAYSRAGSPSYVTAESLKFFYSHHNMWASAESHLTSTSVGTISHRVKYFRTILFIT